MLEFACHTWAFTDLTLPEALGTIARLGFSWADIGSGANFNAVRAADNPRKAAAEIRADLDLFNLKVSDLYLLLPRIGAADEARRAKEMELYRALLPFAAELGAPGITLSPGLPEAADPQGARDRAVAALRDMVRLGGEAGLQVSVEPHLDSLAPTAAAAQRLLDDVPGLRLTVDWAHLVCGGAAHDDILGLLPHARHIQVRQAARDKLQTPFDAGTVDAAQVIAGARAAAYTGVICVEYMNTPGWHGLVSVNAVREIARMRDALRAARDA